MSSEVLSTRKGRGPSKPPAVRLAEAIEVERKRVEFHEKHLKEAKAALKDSQAKLTAFEDQERETATAKIAEYEAELKRLKALIK
jgi:hypothetical protein